MMSHSHSHNDCHARLFLSTLTMTHHRLSARHVAVVIFHLVLFICTVQRSSCFCEWATFEFLSGCAIQMRSLVRW